MGWSAWRINIVYAICTLFLGGWAFGIQKDWLSLMYVMGCLSTLMLMGGTLTVEWCWTRYERKSA